ncbi:MAG TPA: hypothetical protein VMI72_07400 [Roseiarcus sp.]|nr:hypothetical protein [Roseiarcus sp.]
MRAIGKVGVEDLFDRSRAPHHHPQAIADEIAERGGAARRAHPTWGPLKARAFSRAAGAFDRPAGGERDRPPIRSPRADGEARAAPPQPSRAPFGACDMANGASTSRAGL